MVAEPVRLQRAFARVGLGRRLCWIEAKGGERKTSQMLSDSELDRCGQDDLTYWLATYDAKRSRWTLGERLWLKPDGF